MENLEDEFKNLDNLVNEMKEGMQEEFATIKFEVNNAIVDVKRDFEKDLIALTTELNEMKKPNWNLKYGIIGFMFAMVVVFISYRI
jgi:hypothetical protein